jgi:hypothetical protein
MKKFIYIYSGGNGMPADEAVRRAYMLEWSDYFGKIGASLVDGGAPFVPGGKLLGGGSASGATGYTIIKSDSLEKAVALTQGHPLLARGGGIEVLECVDMSGMM